MNTVQLLLSCWSKRLRQKKSVRSLDFALPDNLRWWNSVQNIFRLVLAVPYARWWWIIWTRFCKKMLLRKELRKLYKWCAITCQTACPMSALPLSFSTNLYLLSSFCKQWIQHSFVRSWIFALMLRNHFWEVKNVCGGQVTGARIWKPQEVAMLLSTASVMCGTKSLYPNQEIWWTGSSPFPPT